MQVYRGMDIGTAKPDPGVRKNPVHHLVDIITPQDEFSCAEFSQRARILITEIIKRKKLPLLVGGSGLYLRALVDGLFSGPSRNQKLRDKLARQAKRYGSQYLYRKLNKLDPCSASKVHPHDQRRIIRALEVYQKTKVPIFQDHLNPQNKTSRQQ